MANILVATASAAAGVYPITWTISGAAAAPAAYTASDGYQVVAALTWFVDTLTAQNATGHCVETLTSAGVALTAGAATSGNFAICHILDISITAETPTAVTYSHLVYLNEAQWGAGATASITATFTNSNLASAGSKVATATYGTTFSPTNSSVTAFTNTSVISWTLFQPTAATSYATGLRRYSAGDKVKGYTMARCTAACAVTASPVGVVTLTGASALVAGATVALAALAF